MKAIKLLFLSILLLTQLAGCLGNNGTAATATSSTKISYAGSTDQATLTQTDSAVLLAGAYQGGQTGGAFGSIAALSKPIENPAQPRTLALSQALSNAIARAYLNSPTTHINYAALVGDSNTVPGSCGGQMSYTFTTQNVDEEGTHEFYANFIFDNYCNDSTTINGSAKASGQVNETEPDADADDSTANNNAYSLDMFNNQNDRLNPLSITFDDITISSAGDSFTANGYALITKEDEVDADENPDTDAGNEPINPKNTPDTDDSAASGESPDVGDSTTIKLDCLLRDNNTKLVYKTEKLVITLTAGANYSDANISGRYYDPQYGYVDISTPTPLRINDGNYWPSSGVLKAIGAAGTLTETTGINTSASFTALSNPTTYQLDVDTDGDGAADITTTGLWSAL